MDIQETISVIQKKLGITVDGKAGPQTWSAIYAAFFPKQPPPLVLQPTNSPLATEDRVDARSEQTISTLLPPVRPYARALVVKAAAAGITIKIIGGTRTYDEQNALYAQGRTAPGNKVTNARGGYSNHNFGIAFDIGVFERNKYLPESPKYKAVATIGMELGLEWGGNWKTIVDEPHFELPPNWARDLTEKEMLADLRQRRKEGSDPFVSG